MKNTCPKCDTAYNVSASVIGRKFTCKNCNTPVIVTAAGLDYQTPPAASPPPAAEPAAAAFDFDGGGEEEERKPAKASKSKPAKRAVSDDEPEEEDDRPVRPAKRRSSGGGGDLGEYLAFRKFLAPLVIKVIFWLLVLIIVGGGLLFAGLSVISGRIEGMLVGAGVLFIGVPFYLLTVRIYCELILLAFAAYDRLSEIKTLLEKNGPPPNP